MCLPKDSGALIAYRLSVANPINLPSLNAALRRLGFAKDEMTGHGFRSAASSMLNESGLWNADAIERQLAHVDDDSVRRAYGRADFWDERVRIWHGRPIAATKCAERTVLPHTRRARLIILDGCPELAAAELHCERPKAFESIDAISAPRLPT